MKKDLQNLARKNGQSAKVKAGRVAIMLKLYQDDPRARIWLRFEAARLAKPNKRAPLAGAPTEP